MSSLITIASVATAATTIGSTVYNDVSAGGKGSGGSGDGQSLSGQQYAYYGPHVSTTPLSNSAGSKAENESVTMPLSNKVTEAKVTDADQVPAARDSRRTTTDDFNNVWANRLNKYLDYNTRTLG